MSLFLSVQVRDASTGELHTGLRGVDVTICEVGTNTPLPITEGTDPNGSPVPGSKLTVGQNFAVPTFRTGEGIYEVDAVAADGTRATLQSVEGALEDAAAARQAALDAQAEAEAAKVAAEQAASGASGLPQGGTTGQALVKASNDDYDVTWGNAGTGSGTVTEVAGVGPDEDGNVPLTPEDIAAAPVQHTHDAGQITTGKLDPDRIPNLGASVITSGVFEAARIPNLDAYKINTGVLDGARIPSDLEAYVHTDQPDAAAGDLLAVGNDKKVAPIGVEAATAADIDYDGASTVADVLADLLARVEALEVTGPSIVNLALPTISGTFEVDEEVTASTGTWDPTPDSYAYQWQRDGVDIPGETSSTYTLTAADLGVNRVRVKVTATKSGHTPGVAYSLPISVAAEIEFLGVLDVYEPSGSTSEVELSRGVADVREGDFLVAVLGSGHSNASSDFTAQSGSGTWSRLGPAWPGAGASNRVCGFYGHVVGELDAEPTDYEFAHTPGTATPKAGQLLHFRYVNPQNPVNVASSDYHGTSITNGRRATSLTVTENGCVALFAGWKEGSSSSSTTISTSPSGMTHVEQAVGGTVGETGITVIETYRQDVDAGSTGDKDIQWSAATHPRAHMIVLQGVPSESSSSE